MIGQQVDLVDVEDAPVRPGQQPWLEDVVATKRPPEVERTEQPVERRTER